MTTKTIKTPAERRDFYTAAALDALNNGFTSKAGAKNAAADVTRAYETLRRELQDACLATPRIDDRGSMEAPVEAVYWDVPSYPHQFKAKHSDLIRAAFGDRFDALIANAFELVALREAILAAPVAAPMKDEAKVQAARIVESIRERMDRLNVRYLEAIDLTTVFEDGFVMEGLSANSHYVTNEHGTTFLRTYFFLFGKLTPLNLILAAAQEARRQAEAR
jgi:hypothetical protein